MNRGKNPIRLALIGAGAVGAYFISGYEKLKEQKAEKDAAEKHASEKCNVPEKGEGTAEAEKNTPEKCNVPENSEETAARKQVAAEKTGVSETAVETTVTDKSESVIFTVIADGARKERLRKEGIRINDTCYHPSVMTPEEAGPQDVILIATKYQGLDSAIAMLPPMIGENTLVLSLLNGVDSEEKIAAKIGEEHVVYSVMRISSEHKNGEIHYRKMESYMGVFYGIRKEQTSALSLGATARLSQLFDLAGLSHHPLDDILADMWGKYAANVSNNLPQAILGTSADLYSKSTHGKWMAENLWKEVTLVAEKKGIHLSEKPVIWDIPGARYSTLQDIEAGRPTEVDMLAGTLMRLAKEVGVEVPYATYTFHLIKAVEERNRGMFV